MSVVQRLVFEWPDDIQPILFLDWIKLLSESEQEEFYQAKERQEAHRQQAINDQRMEMSKGTYIWTNQEEANKNKPSDPTWVKYFQRYLRETNTQFKVIYEEVVETVGQGPGR
jgi:hypothetical protein